MGSAIKSIFQIINFFLGFLIQLIFFFHIGLGHVPLVPLLEVEHDIILFWSNSC